MKRITIHGPTQTWNHIVDVDTLGKILLAFQTDSRIIYTHDVGDPWGKAECEYFFNPAQVVCIEVMDY